MILEDLRASADSFLGVVCLPLTPANSVFHTKTLRSKRRKGRTSVKLGSNLKRLVTKWKIPSRFFLILFLLMATITWGWRHAKMVQRCQKCKTRCFQAIPSLLFHRDCLGSGQERTVTCWSLNFRLRKNVLKLGESLVFFLVCWTLHRSRISLSFKKIRYSASQCYSVHVVYSARNVFVAQHKRSNFNIWALWNVWYYSIYRSNVSIRSFIIQLLGTWRLCRPGGREFDDQSLSGDGEIDPHTWGNIFFFVANWLRSKRCT